jgi:hypothetical protein
VIFKLHRTRAEQQYAVDALVCLTYKNPVLQDFLADDRQLCDALLYIFDSPASSAQARVFPLSSM